MPPRDDLWKALATNVSMYNRFNDISEFNLHNIKYSYKFYLINRDRTELDEWRNIQNITRELLLCIVMSCKGSS